jgi:hypothetical protein
LAKISERSEQKANCFLSLFNFLCGCYLPHLKKSDVHLLFLEFHYINSQVLHACHQLHV